MSRLTDPPPSTAAGGSLSVLRRGRPWLAGALVAVLLATSPGCGSVPAKGDDFRSQAWFRSGPSKESDDAVRQQAKADPFPTAAEAGVRTGKSP